jgi:hypothetical protein
LAPRTTAPDGSVTVPTMVPLLMDCAESHVTPNKAKLTQSNGLYMSPVLGARTELLRRNSPAGLFFL